MGENDGDLDDTLNDCFTIIERDALKKSEIPSEFPNKEIREPLE
jgi:hypothetical protein